MTARSAAAFAPDAEGVARDVARSFDAGAAGLLTMVPEDSAELTAGLRKLLEAKDCFVRAAIAASQDADR